MLSITVGGGGGGRGVGGMEIYWQAYLLTPICSSHVVMYNPDAIFRFYDFDFHPVITIGCKASKERAAVPARPSGQTEPSRPVLRS